MTDNSQEALKQTLSNLNLNQHFYSLKSKLTPSQKRISLENLNKLVHFKSQGSSLTCVTAAFLGQQQNFQKTNYLAASQEFIDLFNSLPENLHELDEQKKIDDQESRIIRESESKYTKSFDDSVILATNDDSGPTPELRDTLFTPKFSAFSNQYYIPKNSVPYRNFFKCNNWASFLTFEHEMQNENNAHDHKSYFHQIHPNYDKKEIEFHSRKTSKFQFYKFIVTFQARSTIDGQLTMDYISYFIDRLVENFELSIPKMNITDILRELVMIGVTDEEVEIFQSLRYDCYYLRLVVLRAFF